MNLEKLSGDKLKKIADIFNFECDVEAYYNDFNIVFIDPVSHEQFARYLQMKNLILTLDFPEFNCHLWVYRYYNDNLFDSYLSEGSK